MLKMKSVSLVLDLNLILEELSEWSRVDKEKEAEIESLISKLIR